MGMPKKEANRILSKCDKQTGSRKDPFPRAYPQIVGVISNLVKGNRKRYGIGSSQPGPRIGPSAALQAAKGPHGESVSGRGKGYQAAFARRRRSGTTFAASSSAGCGLAAPQNVAPAASGSPRPGWRDVGCTAALRAGSAGGPAWQLHDVAAASAIVGPGVHQLPALLEKFPAAIGGFNAIADRVRHRHLDHVIWRPRLANLVRPVFERRPKPMRGRYVVIAGPFQHSHGRIFTERLARNLTRKKVFALWISGHQAFGKRMCRRR